MPDFLQNELVQRYLKRSALFWKFSREARFARWQKEARSAAWKTLRWDCKKLGITPEGKASADRLGFAPTEVFAHPGVLKEKPELFDYYRLLACLSNKGFGQIRTKLGLSRKNSKSPETFCVSLCVLLNRFMCNALERTASANREALIRTMFAEAGSEWQGTWVNEIGELAAREIEKLIINFAQTNQLVDEAKTETAADEGNFLILKSGASIRFGSEPDVEFRNARKELACVIEIKGSADKAGAQTRLGETKKSFTKARLQNPRCVTIFLPSVLTKAVEEQLRSERDIDKIFNLLEVCNDKSERAKFLNEIFRFVMREF